MRAIELRLARYSASLRSSFLRTPAPRVGTRHRFDNQFEPNAYILTRNADTVVDSAFSTASAYSPTCR
jgi:hypothetical protein